MPSLYLPRSASFRRLLLLGAWTVAFAAPAAQQLGATSPAVAPLPPGAPDAGEAASPFGTEPVPKMTLRAAQEYALKNQPAVKAALARVSARQADVAIPRGRWLPSVGLTAQVLVGTANNTTASYLNEPFVPTPRVGGTTSVDSAGASWSPKPSTFAGLGVTQEIFDFGRITAEVSAADSLLTAEQRSAEAQTLDIRFGVEEAYFAVYSAKAVVVATEEAYERARLNYELARAGVVSGLRPPIDQTRIQAELARFDITRIHNRGAVRIAQTLFAAAVGSPEAVLDIADQAPAPSDMPPLDAAVQRAIEKEPALQAALARIQAQEDQTRAAFAQFRPDLFFAGTLNARAGGAQPSGSAPIPSGGGWLPGVPNWQLALVISWPLFDGTLWARGRASEQMETVRREEAAVVRQQVVAGVNNAYVTVVVAREALPRIQTAVNAAQANYAQAEARFRGGLGTSTELADAAALLVEAQTGLVLGEFDLARARAAFGRSIAEGL
jgi:outer membrane protein